MAPGTTYAESPDGAIAYQVFGEGSVDLVFVTQWGANIDNYWDEPSAVRCLDRLASSARVVIFDKGGTGVSDPVPMETLPLVDHVDGKHTHGHGCRKIKACCERRAVDATPPRNPDADSCIGHLLLRDMTMSTQQPANTEFALCM